MTAALPTAKELNSFVARILDREKEIKILNDDKRDIFAEAKKKAINIPALKKLISHRRGPSEASKEADVFFQAYLEIADGTDRATRAPARATAKPIPQTVSPEFTQDSDGEGAAHMTPHLDGRSEPDGNAGLSAPSPIKEPEVMSKTSVESGHIPAPPGASRSLSPLPEPDPQDDIKTQPFYRPLSVVRT